MCPVCGTPLELASEAPQAERERALITRLVDGCQTKEQVKARLVAEFGDEVLALPDDEGFDLAAYLVPGLGLLIGGGAVAAAALGWRRSRRAGAPRRRRAAGRRQGGAPAVRPRPVRPVIAADGVDTTVVAAFGVGFISFISPCVLPLVPGYLSTISGRLLRRHPGGQGPREGARPGAAVLPLVHRDVRGAGDDGHRGRHASSRTTAGCCSRSPAWC